MVRTLLCSLSRRVSSTIIANNVRQLSQQRFSSSTSSNSKTKRLWPWVLLAVPLSYFSYTQVEAKSKKQKEEAEKNAEDNFSFATCLPSEAVAGDPTSLKSKILEGGANVLQNFGPISSIHMHLCALHFYSGDINRQVQAHHYCTHLSEDLAQCVIYDNGKPGSRLIGVEFIISEKLYKTLPEEEKKMWHSHVFEIKSGQLTMPGIPEPIERIAMKELINTYGKTWHFWQIDRGDTLPLGIPQLMMALTEDGQITPAAEKILREHTKGINMEERKEKRKEIKYNPIDPDANSWEKGDVVTLKLDITKSKV